MMNIILNALHAIIESTSSLLTWIKTLFIVGFVIIVVVILGALLEVLVRLYNYRNGTQLQTGPILKGLLTSLWKESLEKTKRRREYRKKRKQNSHLNS